MGLFLTRGFLQPCYHSLGCRLMRAGGNGSRSHSWYDRCCGTVLYVAIFIECCFCRPITPPLPPLLPNNLIRMIALFTNPTISPSVNARSIFAQKSQGTRGVSQAKQVSALPPLTAGIPIAKYVTANSAVHGSHRLHVLEAVVMELRGRPLPCPSLVYRGQCRRTAI